MSDKIVMPDLIRMRERGEKIVMLTAYDYTFATLVDAAGAHVILVGDSLGSVVQGLETTLPVTLDEVIYHSRVVRRGVKKALVVADMPFMSFQLGPIEALAAAGRLVKEAGVEGVKLEGGKAVSDAISKIVCADIPVMGHVGLTPQSYHRMGGHRVQGRKKLDAERIFEDAVAVQQAGAFAVVLEGIPSQLAASITRALEIPTIGIGAGVDCDGQVLVINDLLGLTAADCGESPKFVKKYANLKDEVIKAVGCFAEEVKNSKYPDEEHSYSVKLQQLRPICSTTG